MNTRRAFLKHAGALLTALTFCFGWLKPKPKPFTEEDMLKLLGKHMEYQMIYGTSIIHQKDVNDPSTWRVLEPEEWPKARYTRRKLKTCRIS